MADRKAFLLRVDPALLEALQRWADDDFRSLNGQIEFVLRRSLGEAGRLRSTGRRDPSADDEARPPAEGRGGTRKGDAQK